MKLPAKIVLLALAAALSACSSLLEGDKIDYKSAGKGISLEVPPDLTQLSRDTRYQMPGGTVSASNYQVGQAAATGVPVAATAMGDVRIERAGSQRWLVVNRPADQLWGPIREFWQENGFLLTQDQQALGIMETDWAENRAKIPQDFIRNTLGRLIDQIYSTAERDRFRTRLERSPTGGTEIFVSHRGMVEVYSSAQKDQTVWQPRATDPELETEFLRRLMVKLGVPPEQQRTATAASRPTSRVTTLNNQPVVVIDEAFDRAWRRVGLALDRTGFTVEDRDRNNGTYFVRYVEPSADRTQNRGFIARMLNLNSSDRNAPPVKYRINLKTEGQTTTVAVLNANGAPETSATAQRIVQVIADDLK
ncbi:outer membrane protein assembly factor BamC [Ramlibacter sp.]|uniref:outer membrane protein assembly factor BamC n=1 Tax=Ramlibacter sp. TaxID=1917967 RepID=UPI003D150900